MNKARPVTAHFMEFFQNQDLDKEYRFSGTSLQFRDFSLDSKLVYYTFDSNVNPSDVKDLAMKTFENNYQKPSMLSGSSLFYGGLSRDKSIGELNELKDKKINELEELKAKNFYWPFSKKNGFWNDGTRAGSTILYEILSLIPASAAVDSFYSGEIKSGIALSLTSLIALGILKFSRKDSVRRNKEGIKEIEKNIQYYNNFKDNLERAEIKIVSPLTAQEIKNNLLDPMTQKINLDYINNQLSKIYSKNSKR